MSNEELKESNGVHIRVFVLSASNLCRKNIFNPPDPFAKISVEGTQTNLLTEVRHGTSNPKWNQHFDFYLSNKDSLAVSLWNHKKLHKSSGFLGCIKLPFTTIIYLKDTGAHSFDLQNSANRLFDESVIRGSITISISLRSMIVVEQYGSKFTSLNLNQMTPSSNGDASRVNGIRNAVVSQDLNSVTPTNVTRVANGTRRTKHTAHHSIGHTADNSRNRSRGEERPRRMNRTASQGNCLESTPVENNISPAFSPFTSHVDEHCLPLSPAVLPSNPPAPPVAHTTSANQPIDSTHNSAAAMPREGPQPGEIERNFPAPEIPMEVATSGRVEEVGRLSHRQNEDPHNSRVTSTPLPDGYKQKVTPQGQIYYHHIPSGISTWYDPRVTRATNGCMSENLSPLLAQVPLPEGWEIKHTSTGRKYFVNHNNKTTQFTDPRLVSLINRDQSPAFNLRFPPHLSESSPLREVTRQNVVSTPPSSSRWGKSECRDSLMLKIKKLSQELQKFKLPSGHCRIEISRNNIFEDSYKQVMKRKSVELHKRLLIKFKGEEGIDYGGIAREWLFLLSREMFNPCFGLFAYTSDNYLHINPDSHVNPNHLFYFFFIGRIIGLSIFHGHHLEANFTKPFLKQLLKLPVDLLDIEAVDSQLYKSLLWVKENDITGVLESTFSVDHNTFGERVTHELKPDGENIPVTEENKKEYIDLYVKWRLHRGCESQMKALLKGFHELIPRQLLVDFDVEDIELGE